MKKNILFILLGFCLLLTSCGVSDKTYNNKAIEIYSSYSSRLSSVNSKFLNPSLTKDEAKVIIKDLTTLTDSCMTATKKLEPSENAKQFHEKLLNVYSVVSTDLIPAIGKLVELRDAKDLASLKNTGDMIQQLSKSTTKVADAESEAMKAQREFSEKAGLTLQ